MNAVDNQTLWRKLRVFCDADGHWKKVEQRETVNICSFVENAYDKNTALDKDKVSQLTFSVIFIPLFHFGPPVSFISFVSPVSLLSTMLPFRSLSLSFSTYPCHQLSERTNCLLLSFREINLRSLNKDMID